MLHSRQAQMAFLILYCQQGLFDVSQIDVLNLQCNQYINFHLSYFSKHKYKTLFYIETCALPLSYADWAGQFGIIIPYDSKKSRPIYSHCLL